MTPPTASRPSVAGFPLGDYMTNCYVVTPGNPGETAGGPGPCWIADLGMSPGPLLEHLAGHDLVPEVVVLTHAHVDHIAGLFEFRSRYPGVPIWIHRAEERWLTDPALNLSAFAGVPVTAPEPDRLLDAGETLELCGQPWRVLHTPGHSPGGITLVHDDSRQAIVGDALFNGSIGRTDFPGSDFGTLARAIRTQLYTLPDETLVYPGHGPSTTIGDEKRHNPFVRPE